MSPADAPKMRRAPPMPPRTFGAPVEPARALADDLNTLDDWLVQPTTPEAMGIDGKSSAERRPWDGIDPHRTQQLNVYIPTILHAKLRWVVQSEYGLSMKDVVISALEEAVERALKAQKR